MKRHAMPSHVDPSKQKTKQCQDWADVLESHELAPLLVVGEAARTGLSIVKFIIHLALAVA
jgi:hypothetical protein